MCCWAHPCIVRATSALACLRRVAVARRLLSVGGRAVIGGRHGRPYGVVIVHDLKDHGDGQPSTVALAERGQVVSVADGGN